MEIYTLKLFLNLSESLHFGKTSRACHLSPSALSRQIQRLEAELGKPLFERDNRQVTLTAQGQMFRGRAREIVEKWEAARDELQDREGDLRGELRIYASVTACYSILPDLLEKFRRNYPLVHIKIETGNHSAALDKISSGELDVAVAALPEKLPPGLCFKEITQTSLVFIAPGIDWPGAGLLAEPEIPWGELPFILPEKDLARDRVEAWLRRRGVRPDVYAQVAGNEALLALVALGCGVGVVPLLVVQKQPLSNPVRVLKVEPPLEPYVVGLVSHRRKLNSSLVSAFWESC